VTDWCEPGHRWRLLLPAGTTVVELPASPWARRRVRRQVAALPPGTTVALVDDAPASRLRGRRLARAAHVRLDREYVALPRLASAVCLVQDAPASTRWAVAGMLTVPPGVAVLHAPLDAAIRLLRRSPARLGGLAPGRVLVGERTP
jgi:hypothetical protein